MDLPVDDTFVQHLPKAELHAHLSGSVSRNTLHAIWVSKKVDPRYSDLEDPSLALKPSGDYPTVLSFFDVFNQYIYRLLDDEVSIARATKDVLEDFQADGVRYLELRTTPRAIPGDGIDWTRYVEIVLDAIDGYHKERSYEHPALEPSEIECHLILSIDRAMSLDDAIEIVRLADRIQRRRDMLAPTRGTPRAKVLGIDLCGNPTKVPITHLEPAFCLARSAGLKITVHFAEIPASSTAEELWALLSWQPDRLGHAINIPESLKEIIKSRRLGLELCLSCNVLAKLTPGSFRDHHFGEWRESACAIALGTDDVGVFESALSNEYRLVAEHFALGRREVLELARSAVTTAWAGKERMKGLIDQFERQVQ